MTPEVTAGAVTALCSTFYQCIFSRVKRVFTQRGLCVSVWDFLKNRMRIGGLGLLWEETTFGKSEAN